ncbi:acetyltransferase [Cordyceps fumosorosea ARSEF 2679]|uniref:Acetyltransferase n=1 Tax=Cordyceps fumosorosea (strain ARSEF 2679) TaxID=1081104 RepID=A0A162MRK2_CORFA|nr:acetyltransferase [Cordyceps fumosorosea ARSEF 2679]OAA69109.1 acetyltransferase [Cordyceps fumosorosea ARSEF 2679]
MSTSLHYLYSNERPDTRAGTVLFETSRLIIRRFQMADAASLAAAMNHKEVVAQLSDRFQYPYTVSDAEAAISQSFPSEQDDECTAAYPRSVAVCIKPGTVDNASSEPRLIGSMVAHAGKDMAYRTWSLGYALTPDVWGRGYAAEAVTAFRDWLFATWPRLARLEASVFSTNPASARVLLKAGFDEEGIRRDSLEKNGVLLDARQFAVLRCGRRV